MGYRLSRITTRTGDDGSTGLGDGRRIGKDALRIAALGDVDELNSYLGLLLTETLPTAIQTQLTTIQHDLFDLGSELCIPGFEKLSADQVAQLDQWLAEHNAGLPPLKEFILPGGSRSAALAHVARTVCRRAERTVVCLGRTEIIRSACRQYLNRLSDWLFVVARTLNQASGGTDAMWEPRRNTAAQDSDEAP